MRGSIVAIVAIVAVAAWGGLAAPAAAGPLAEALAKPDAAAVARLRAQRGDLGARCTLGAVYAARNDLARAALYLAGCDEDRLPAEIAAQVARTSRDVARLLRDGDLARLEVISKPEGMTAETDALPGETFVTPATLWVKAGTYEVRATLAGGGGGVMNRVTAEPRSRGVVMLDGGGAAPRKPVVAEGTQSVDFTAEAAVESQNAGPPPDVKHKSILPNKYGRGVAAAEPDEDGPVLADPLAGYAGARRAPRTTWLGLRLGGGVFHDASAEARAGAVVALAARYALRGPWFIATRADWSRRGSAAIDTLGASAGAGLTLLDRRALSFAAIAQLRGDLRVSPGAAFGASAAVSVELAIPATPITFGLRTEHGLTSIVPGARDRAVLLELGADWR